jgi:hypothetical protein
MPRITAALPGGQNMYVALGQAYEQHVIGRQVCPQYHSSMTNHVVV